MFRLKGQSKFDYLLFVAMIAACFLGFFMLFAHVWQSLSMSTALIWKQFIAFCLGLIGVLLIAQLDYRHLNKYAYWIYGLVLTLLVAVLLVGKVARGARSWFALGPFSFQPSEFMPLALIIVLAKYIDSQPEWKNHRIWWACLLYTLLPAGLILLQPDFGSTIVLIPIFLGLAYLGEVQAGYLISTVLAGMIAMFISLFLTSAQLSVTAGSLGKFGLWVVSIFSNFNNTMLFLLAFYVFLVLIYFVIRKAVRDFSFKNVWFVFLTVVLGVVLSAGIQHFLRDYQRARLIAFLDPKVDPLGVGYNIIQSKVAIGSGQFLGKGILAGTQSHLGFLPEQYTDFIFSVIGEELGFVGTGLLLGLFLVIIWRGITIMNKARDRFGSLLATGVVCLFATHAILNIGMVMGIMPVVGVPLPLVSYGGSSLIAHMLAVGILLGVHYRRYMY
ncbi:MAG: rod shape-determining protein RodA [bacterium]